MTLDAVVWLALLASARVWALARAQVVWRTAAGSGWGLWCVPVALGMGSGFALGSDVTGVVSLSVIDMAIGLGFELALGTVIGGVVALPGLALVGAMEQATVTWRVAATGRRAFVTLMAVVTLLGAVALHVHRPFVAAVFTCLHSWPVGEPGAWLGVVDELDVGTRVLAWAHVLVVLALAFVVPVLLIAAVVDIATRLASASGPVAEQLAAGVAPWGRLGAALIGLWISYAAYSESWARVLTIDVR